MEVLAVVSVSMAESGHRECLYVVGQRSEAVGSKVVDAGLAVGEIAAAGWAIAAVVAAADEVGWAIAAAVAAVAVGAVVVIAAVAHVIHCALVVVCRFALRLLVEC